MSDDIIIRLFEKLDAYTINLRPQDEAVRNDPFFEAWVKKNEGASFTAIRKSDGKILGCGGIRVISEGMGEAWCLYCDEIDRYKKEAYEYAFAYLPELIKKLNLNWLQARVRADNKIAIRYAENLGFKRESIDGDYFIYLISTGIKQATPLALRAKIQVLEDKMKELPDVLYGDCFPLEHFHARGLYGRKIKVPAGVLITSKIHKYSHFFFLLEGEIEILEGSGTKRLSAPAFFVTPAGTKRAVYHHKDAVVMTVHATEETDIKRIEAEIIARDFDELESQMEKLLISEGVYG